MKFERGRTIGLPEGEFSFSATFVHRNSSTMTRVQKQWTDKHRTIGKNGSDDGRGRQRATNTTCFLAHRTAFRQLAIRQSTTTGVLNVSFVNSQSITPWTACKGTFYMIPFEHDSCCDRKIQSCNRGSLMIFFVIPVQ